MPCKKSCEIRKNAGLLTAFVIYYVRITV